MKVSLAFETQEDKITIFYRSFVMSLIKQALNSSNPEYFQKLYYWDGKKNKWTKPFCFAVYFPEFKLIDDNIYCNKQFIINISSSDYEFIINLTNGLLQDSLYPFQIPNRNSFILKNSTYVKENEINNDVITLKAISPILIERTINGKKYPVTPFDNDFADYFNTVIDMEISSIRFLQTGEKKGLFRRLEFEPLRIKKEVVKHKINEFQSKTGKEYMTLTGFTGHFVLKGHPEDLNLICQNGLGLRRSQGFGYVEVI